MDGGVPAFDVRRWHRQFAVAQLQDVLRDLQNPEPGPEEVWASLYGQARGNVEGDPTGLEAVFAGVGLDRQFLASASPDLEYVAVTQVPRVRGQRSGPPIGLGAKVASKHEPGHATDDIAAEETNAYTQAVAQAPGGVKARWDWYLTERAKALDNRTLERRQEPCVWISQTGCGGSVDDGTTFQIPVEANWGSHVLGANCALKGTEGDCPPPQIYATQSCEVCSDCTHAYIPYIDADLCPAGFNVALRLAWCFLVENIDIVRWVICRVWGVSSECVANLLLTGDDAWGANVDLTCADLSGVVAITWAWPWPLGPVITWNAAGRHVKRYAGIVSCSGSPAERLCAIIDLASVLLHELCHACLAGADISSTSSDCTDALLVEHSARWAFLLRYPTALTAACCRGPWDTNGDGIVNDAEFMDTSGTLLGSTCDSTC